MNENKATDLGGLIFCWLQAGGIALLQIMPEELRIE